MEKGGNRSGWRIVAALMGGVCPWRRPCTGLKARPSTPHRRHRRATGPALLAAAAAAMADTADEAAAAVAAAAAAAAAMPSSTADVDGKKKKRKKKKKGGVGLHHSNAITEVAGHDPAAAAPPAVLRRIETELKQADEAAVARAFWDTQPVPKLSDDISVSNAPIEEPGPVPPEPCPLHASFEWVRSTSLPHHFQR